MYILIQVNLLIRTLVGIAVLIGVAFLTLLERKVLGSMQLRVGPQTVGVWGVLQPFADAVKLLAKESIILNHANTFILLLAPIISLVLVVTGWAVIPFGTRAVLADINIGILYLFAVSSLGAYAMWCLDWASNSRYSFLGVLDVKNKLVLEFHTEYSVVLFFLFVMIELIRYSARAISLGVSLGANISAGHLFLAVAVIQAYVFIFLSSLITFILSLTSHPSHPSTSSLTAGSNNVLYLIGFTGLSRFILS